MFIYIYVAAAKSLDWNVAGISLIIRDAREEAERSARSYDFPQFCMEIRFEICVTPPGTVEVYFR